MRICHSEYQVYDSVWLRLISYSVPQCTGGWSSHEAAGGRCCAAAVAVRKGGVPEPGHVSVGGTRCVQTCGSRTAADVPSTHPSPHHGLELSCMSRLPVNARRRLRRRGRRPQV